MSATLRFKKLLTLLGSCGGSRMTPGLSVVGPLPELRDDPRVGQFDDTGVLRSDDLSSQHSGVKLSGSDLILDRSEVGDEETILRNRCIR